MSPLNTDSAPAIRVGLNATCYNDRPSGARQRFVSLYGSLISRHPDIRFVVYDPVDCAVSRAFSSAANVEAIRTPIPSSKRIRKAWAGLGYWQQRLRADRLDLFEQFNVPIVVAPDCPTILTVHDIRDARGPTSLLRTLYRAVWHRALTRATHVVTVSDTMREEILEFQPGIAVTTIYNGLDPAPFREARPAGTGYLLAVGHLEPRKNYDALVAAMAILAARGHPIDLVIVGRDAGCGPALEAQISAAGLAGRVTILSDVDDAGLAALYAGCDMLVFPSRYEGFGIPLIEAMAAGRPFVTSDIPVFRELSQDRGIYFPAEEPEAIADAIARVLSDAPVAQALIGYGTRRIEDFAIDRLSDQIATLYGRLVPGSIPSPRSSPRPPSTSMTRDTDAPSGGIS